MLAEKWYKCNIVFTIKISLTLSLSFSLSLSLSLSLLHMEVMNVKYACDFFHIFLTAEK